MTSYIINTPRSQIHVQKSMHTKYKLNTHVQNYMSKKYIYKIIESLTKIIAWLK